jgi:predicted permease
MTKIFSKRFNSNKSLSSFFGSNKLSFSAIITFPFSLFLYVLGYALFTVQNRVTEIVKSNRKVSSLAVISILILSVFVPVVMFSIPSVSATGITQVQSTSGHCGAVTSLVLTDFTNTPSESNQLVLAVTSILGQTCTPTSANTAWSLLTTRSRDVVWTTDIWLGVPSASAGKSITVTFGSAPAVGAVVICNEYSGLASTPLDKSAGADDSSTTPGLIMYV